MSLAQLVRDAARRGGNLGLLAWQRHVRGRRIFEKRIYDYRLLVDADDPGICRQLIRRGERELEQKLILERELRAGMRVLDLGANIGYYTVMMARLVGQRGRVYAVEPIARNFDLLSRNVSRNAIADRTELQQIAIAGEDGEKPLWISERSNWHSFHPPAVDASVPWKRKYHRTMVGQVRVATRSLAGYLAERPPVDLLRMDLEGYETEIFRAILALPARCSSPLRILFETHPEFYQPERNDPRPLLHALCRNGYTIKYLVSDFHFPEGKALFQRYGYGAAHVVKQFQTRAVYTGLAPEDAIDLICDSECVHAAFLARPACD